MTQFGFYSFSEPLNSGIDFYTADMAVLIDSSISVESNVSASAVKIAFSQSSQSIESNVVATSIKISFAAIDINVDGATLTLGTRVKEASCAMSVESSVQSSSIKISAASSSLDSSGSLASSAIKQAISNAVLSAQSALTSSAVKTSFANSNIAVSSSLVSTLTLIKNVVTSLSSSVSISVAGRISLANINIVIENMGALLAQPTILFSNINAAIDSSIYRTLILLDDKPLTNHNRKLDMSVEPIFVETVNWNNRKKRYYKSTNRAGRRVFNISWSWLPNSIEYTADNERGRDFIQQIASDPRGHVLKIINLDESGTTPYTETSYNVLVKDYNETLIRRDLANDVYFWDCSMSLEEV